ncbi:MAG: hypothetical protein GWM87_10010 [Xanthomonadales bacterium]|nr:hypothetical protein [Xanthomonadales bacterium]NIX13230.1 hypothetical protein [Xanthomonadales bacterium]
MRGPLPAGDGWGAIYRLFERVAPPGSGLRRKLCAWFWPARWERAGSGRVYRLLGAAHFGRVIPTGGVAVRRLTGSRMAPYTLRGPSVGAAREFYYRACCFEAAHMPFMLALLFITVQRFLEGRIDLAMQDMLVNLAVNIYPIMHHRNTRRRIVRLLERVTGKAGNPA